MLLSIGITLYASRTLLQQLGVSDFGLYAVIGGVVTLFSFLNASLTSSLQRFLNYEMGREDSDRLRRTFSSSIAVMLVLAIVVPIAVTVIGELLLRHTLNVPDSRSDAARLVLYCSALMLAISTVTIPYTSALVANEHMGIVALMGLGDAVVRLVAALLLQFSHGDKLVAYAAMLMAAPVLNYLLVRTLARKRFEECRGPWIVDRPIARSLFSFSSWSLISNVSVVLRTQGTAILINVFHGTVGNAAYAVATQVYGVVGNFVKNFTMSVAPQIVKKYSAGELVDMRETIYFGSRVAMFLVLIVVFPLYFRAAELLQLWLDQVPVYTTEFVRLVLILTVAESVAQIQATAQGATGRIKLYHLTLGLFGLLSLPIVYALYALHYPPYVASIVAVVVSSVIMVLRLLFLKRSIALPTGKYLWLVFGRFAIVVLLASPAPLLVDAYVGNSLFGTIVVMLVAGLSIFLCSAFVGLDRPERRAIHQKIAGKFKRQKQRP